MVGPLAIRRLVYPMRAPLSSVHVTVDLVARHASARTSLDRPYRLQLRQFREPLSLRADRRTYPALQTERCSGLHTSGRKIKRTKERRRIHDPRPRAHGVRGW